MTTESGGGQLHVSCTDDSRHERDVPDCPLVSLVLPAFNEAAMLWSTLTSICNYMNALERRYRWELIVINDGSTDRTGQIAEAFGSSHRQVRVMHHSRNGGLGRALATGFACSRGDYVVVIDSDLSYAPDHIELLLDRIQVSRAKIVVASPYAQGGRLSHVPWTRRILSVWSNRLMASVARCSLSTFTGMVRVYDGHFIRAMNLRSKGQEISPEIIYKGLLLGAHMEEVPAHLNWSLQRAAGSARLSSMDLLPHMLSTLMSGFMFRPFMFFLLPGLLLTAVSMFSAMSMFVPSVDSVQEPAQERLALALGSLATGQAYHASPQLFIIAGSAMIVGIQLIGLGLISLQGSRYFQEMFHLASAIHQHTLPGRNNGRTDGQENGNGIRQDRGNEQTPGQL